MLTVIIILAAFTSFCFGLCQIAGGYSPASGFFFLSVAAICVAQLVTGTVFPTIWSFASAAV